MNRNQYIEGLILKQLQQEISAAEHAELEQWLDVSPANRREYLALVKIWEDSLPVLKRQVFDTGAAWEKIRGGLLQPPASEESVTRFRSLGAEQFLSKKRFANTRWLAAASVLLVLMAAGLLTYRGARRNQLVFVLASDANRPVTLPDGTLAYLRKGASIRYPKAFTGTERMVELRGEAYFDVIHDPDNPFKVKTGLALIEDIGTSFLVKDKDSTEEVVVTTGKVKFTELGRLSRNLVLIAGEKAILTKEGFVQNKTTNPNFIAWKTRVLEFRNTPIDRVLQDIHDCYQVPVGLSPDLQADSGKILLTARFVNQPVKEMLDEVKLMTGLEIRQEKDTLLFFRK